MTERPFQFKKIKEEEIVHHMPPAWCGAICRNAMSEICIEQCAINRDCSGFDPKPDLKLGDMPRFPLKQSANMTKEEKFTSVTIYLAKVVDHLQGVEEERTIYPPLRRRDFHNSGSRSLPENLRVEDLLTSISSKESPSENEVESENVEDESQ